MRLFWGRAPLMPTEPTQPHPPRHHHAWARRAGSGHPPPAPGPWSSSVLSQAIDAARAGRPPQLIPCWDLDGHELRFLWRWLVERATPGERELVRAGIAASLASRCLGAEDPIGLEEWGEMDVLDLLTVVPLDAVRVRGKFRDALQLRDLLALGAEREPVPGLRPWADLVPHPLYPTSETLSRTDADRIAAVRASLDGLCDLEPRPTVPPPARCPGADPSASRPSRRGRPGLDLPPAGDAL